MTVQANEQYAVITQHILTDVPDALTKASPLAEYCFKEGKEKISGGVTIQFPLKLIKNASSAAINGTNSLIDVNPSPQLQYGTMNWKYDVMSFNSTLADFTVANGDDDKSRAGMIATKYEGAKSDFVRDLATQLHGTSVGSPLNFDGLKDICAASGTAYGGLTDTDYTTGALAAYLPYISTDTVISYLAIAKMINAIRARSQQANVKGRLLGLMNAASYTKYQVAVQNQQLFINEKEIVKTGFTGFMVNNIEFFLDADCPGSQDGSTGDNFIYIIPTEALKFYYKFGLGTASPLDTGADGQKIPTGVIKTVQSYLAGNLVCVNRRLLAVGKTFVA